MINIAAVVQRVRGLDPATLEVWIAQDWVRPRREAGAPMFEEIDVARIRLIVELRDDLALGDEAVPVVLSLLDQLHSVRSQVRRVAAALESAGPDGRVAEVLAGLRAP